MKEYFDEISEKTVRKVLKHRNTIPEIKKSVFCPECG